MAGSTPNLNLYLPGGGSTGLILPDETADIDPLNENFRKIDTAIGDVDNQNRQWYGPAADIGTIPVDPKDGDTYQESDGSKTLWRRLGGLWVTNEGGMYLIRPASVTGAGVTIGANGSVVFTNVAPGTVVQILGIFSSRFRNYETRAIWTAKNANVDCPVRGLVGTTPVTSGTHSRAQQFLIAGARADSQATGMTDFGSILTPYWGTIGVSHTRWFSPNAAVQTYTISDWTVLGGTTGVGTLTSNLNSSDQLTGLQITMGAGSPYSGEISFYGLA
jgi:hypothetical protein